MKKKTTLKVLKNAADLFPGATNNAERLPRDWGQQIIVRKAKGIWLTDEDKNTFLDFYLGQGTQIYGHTNPEIIGFARKQLKKGFLTGYYNKKEIELALLLLKYLPQAEQIRFFTGRQAALQKAVHLARLQTNRERVLVFDGSRHGTFGGLKTHLPLNDDLALENYFQQHGNQTALVMIETLPTGSGLLPQRPEFLQKIRSLTIEAGAVLLFDETETAFRAAMGTAYSNLYLDCDVMLLGGVISGGLPFCALAGKKEILAPLAEELPGDSDTEAGYLLGTLTALAYLSKLQDGSIHQQLIEITDYLEKQFARLIAPLFEKREIALSLQSWTGIFNLRFYRRGLELPEPRRLEDIFMEHAQLYSRLQKQLLKRGIYLPPSPTGLCYLSILHRHKEIDLFLEALRVSLNKILPGN